MYTTATHVLSGASSPMCAPVMQYARHNAKSSRGSAIVVTRPIGGISAPLPLLLTQVRSMKTVRMSAAATAATAATAGTGTGTGTRCAGEVDVAIAIAAGGAPYT